MARYVVQLEMAELARHISRMLGCQLTAAEVREVLQAAGLVESHWGWLAEDLRPLALLYLRPQGVL
jgi:hypothetical protein